MSPPLLDAKESRERDSHRQLPDRMTQHHDRARAVLIVQALEAERAGRSGDVDASGWLLAVYDAALAELCGALGVRATPR